MEVDNNKYIKALLEQNQLSKLITLPLDVKVDSNKVVIVSEYIKGSELYDLVNDQKLTLPQLNEVLIEVAEASIV